MANTLTIDRNKDNSPKSTFTLPNKRVRVVPIVRNTKFMNNSEHDGLFMFTGCSQSFVLPYSASLKRLVEPLTDDERLYLTDALKVNLDINHADNFYRYHNIKIKKVSTDLKSLYLELDLSHPMDYLNYKILLQVPVIANSWSERDTNPMYEWAIQDLGEEFEQKVSLGELKQTAYVWLSKHNEGRSKLYDILRVYGLNISTTASLDELKSAIIDIIETPKTVRKLIELLKDVDFEHKLFLDKAIRIGEIIRLSNTKYALVTGDVIGNNLKETIAFIKDKVNNLIIAKIQEKIEVNKI